MKIPFASYLLHALPILPFPTSSSRYGRKEPNTQDWRLIISSPFGLAISFASSILLFLIPPFFRCLGKMNLPRSTMVVNPITAIHRMKWSLPTCAFVLLRYVAKPSQPGFTR